MFSFLESDRLTWNEDPVEISSNFVMSARKSPTVMKLSECIQESANFEDSHCVDFRLRICGVDVIPERINV